MRRLPLLLLSALLTAVLGVTAAAPAWAHTRLVSSTPAQGAVAEAPREVSLAFSDPVQPALSAVSVTSADGEELASGQPSAGDGGTSVSQALRAPLEPGTYRVAYRVLAADGHPVTGSFEITATAPAASVPHDPTATPGPTALTTAATATPEPTTVPDLRPAAAADEQDGLPVLLLVVGGLVVAGVAGLLARRLGGAPPSA